MGGPAMQQEGELPDTAAMAGPGVLSEIPAFGESREGVANTAFPEAENPGVGGNLDFGRDANLHLVFQHHVQAPRVVADGDVTRHFV